MKAFDWRDELTAVKSGEAGKAVIVLLSSTLLMLTWYHIGSAEFYLEHLQSRFQLHRDPDYAAALYFFYSAFVLLGLIPLLVIKIGFREPLAHYGIGLGNCWQTFVTLLFCAPPLVLMAYVVSRFPEQARVFQINRQADLNFGLHAVSFALFYVGWEIHFRGFLQFGLRGTMGSTNAILVAVMASSLMHLGRPLGDVYGGVFAALLWGVLAFQTRSLVSGMVQHCLLGLSLDFFLWIDRV